MNTVITPATSESLVGAANAVSSVSANGGSKIPIVSEPAASPPPQTSISIDVLKQEVSALQDRIAEAEIEMKAAQTAKVLSIPTYLGVEDLEQVLDLLKAQMKDKLQRSRPSDGKPKSNDCPLPASRAHGKGHHLPQSTIAQMRKMLGARQTAAYISETLGIGLSTVESYKARWGLTKHHKDGGKVTKASHNGSSSNRISPEKRNEIVSAFNADHVTVTDMARRFGVSRQSLYTIRRAVKRRQTIAA